MFTCVKKVLFISGDGSEKGQYMTLLKMALMTRMVSITAWHPSTGNCRELYVGTLRVQASSRGKGVLVAGMQVLGCVQA